EIVGRGIEGRTTDGRLLRVGSAAWLRECGLSPLRVERVAGAVSRVEVVLDERVLGSIALADSLRPESAAVVERLKRRGYHIVLASGDGEAPVQAIAALLGIEARARLQPEDKLDLIRQTQSR